MNALVDANARARIERDLDTTLVVEAAAGTGKTTALIARIVAVIRSGVTTLERVVAVTFTEKAAGEMKLRLRSELDRTRQAATTPREQVHLQRALAALEVAHINTIHGFCADILRERPVDAGIDPKFEVLDEAAAEGLLQEAFRSWFESALASPGDGLHRVLCRRNWRSEQTTPREDLLRACRDLIEYRDFDCEWAIPDFDRKAQIDSLLVKLRMLGTYKAQARRSSDQLARALAVFEQWIERLDARERVQKTRDHDAVEVELVELLREKKHAWSAVGYGKLYGDSLDRNAVLTERDAVKSELTAFVALAEADLAARVRKELLCVVRLREQLKQTRGALDFVDLLSYTNELLRNNQGVRAELQSRFTHLFVDEFQDTDPLQAEILLLLASATAETSRAEDVWVKPGKLFVVGDPKQAIYRFRRADVTLYERIKAKLLAQGGELLHLTTNFRSVPSLQAAVNAAFSHWMVAAEDGSQAAYVPLSEHRPEIPLQPGVVALPIPSPYGRWGPTKSAMAASYPQAVGAFIEWLLQKSDWRVHDEDGLSPLKARHVCLLFKRFQAKYQGDVTRPYVQALEARRVPHVLVGGRSFHDREEVVAIRAALEAIEWPDDELSVYAVLRGPLLGISDEQLLAFRHDFSRLRPQPRFEEPECVKHPAVTDGLRLIYSLHAERNRRPIADTVERLLTETRAHASLAMWPSGEQALANALAVVDLARNVDSRGGASFRTFVATLSEQADRGQGGEAPIVEEGTEGVRLMTVYKAKGLEFPVVILCDPTAPFKTTVAHRFTDTVKRLCAHTLCGCRPLELSANDADARRHDDAELVRVAYVAATRARDLLVVPTFGDGYARDVAVGWADALAPALYPSDALRDRPNVAPGCPPFGSDSVLTRDPEGKASPEQAVAPGLHLSEHGNPVVWWDPALLRLHAPALGGVRQQKLLADTPRSSAGIDEHRAWAERRQSTVARASIPSVTATPVTELAQQMVGATTRAAVETTKRERRGRPRGARFGSLVHAILAQAPMDAGRATTLALSKSIARLMGASEEETELAAEAAALAFEHPLLRAAKVSGDVRREVAVSWQLADGRIAEGVIDLAYRTDGGWLVIDFKTDQVSASEEHYSAQLQLYVEAVQRATGEPARGVLLEV